MPSDMEAKLCDVINICSTFPNPPKPEVPRDNLLETIDRIFKGNIELISLEADEGFGKTTLLSQFAKHHPDTSFCIFIRSVTRFSYDPSLIRFDLCNQLEWLLHGCQLPDDSTPDDADVRQYFLEIHRKAKRTGKTYYVIIDGLNEIPKKDQDIRSLIRDMLPIGLPNFKILISGDPNMAIGSGVEKLKHKPFTIPSFSQHETDLYLTDLVKDDKEREEIHKTWKGVPSHLASVRRIIESGRSSSHLLEDMPDELKDLFEIEWSAVDESNELVITALALLAHDKRERKISELAELLSEDSQKIASLLSAFSFIDYTRDNQSIDFISDTFRRFVSTRLIGKREDCIALQIERLLKIPESTESLTSLPTYLELGGRHQHLLDYLTIEHFGRLLNHTHALVDVNKQVQLGLKIATKNNNYPQLFSLCLSKSVLSDAPTSFILKSEVEAYLSSNDYETATYLANSAALIEDRLQLLSVIARKKREQGLHAEPEVLEQITNLYEQLDPAALGAEKALDIAVDLFSAAPDLAIALIEQQASNKERDNKLDWAIVDLSVRAMLSNDKIFQSSEILDSLSGEISDSQVKRIFEAASLFLAPSSASEAIAESQKLDRIADQLLLLRQWIALHSQSDDAVNVMEHTLDLSLATTEFAPTATFFREISEPLPFVKEHQKASKLIGILDGQKDFAHKTGPTIDYVRLQLCLAEAEATHDMHRCENRLLELYLDAVEDISDLSVRAVCLAWFSQAIKRIDKDGKLEQGHGMQSLIKKELHNSVDELLLTTAEHFEAAKPIIEALGSSCPDTALDICLALNNCGRRDQAIELLVDTMMAVKRKQPNYDFAVQSISHLSDVVVVDDAKLSVAKRYCNDIKANQADPGDVSKWVEYFTDVGSPEIRTEIWILFYKALSNSTAPDINRHCSRIVQNLHETWEEIDSAWKRIDMGYQIVSGVGESDIALSKQYMEEISKLRQESLLESEEAAESIFFLIHLAIRAYSAILKSGKDDQSDLERLSSFIGRITSRFNRAFLWGKICCALYLNGRVNEAKELVSNKLRPILESLPNTSSREYAKMYSAVAAALWLSHKQSTLSYVSTLPIGYKYHAFKDILGIVLKKDIPGYPYEMGAKHVFIIDYTDFLDAIDVLRHTDDDSMIYYHVKRLSDSLIGLKKQARLTRNQSEDIVSRLKSLIDEKLPAEHYLEHEGYKIACEANLARIDRPNINAWKQLIARAKNIDNVADKIFLLATIAAALPSKETKLKIDLLNDSKELMKQVSSEYDRLDRYEAIAEIAWEYDSSISKACIQSVFQESSNTDDRAIREKQRDIIDLAYRIDPEFASSLASVADTDPARLRIKSRVDNRVKYLKLKSSFSNEHSEKPEPHDRGISKYPDIAWKQLGGLISGRTAPVHIARVKEVLDLGTKFSLSEAFPIYCWCIENLRAMYANTSQSAEYIRPAFEAILSNLDLLCSLFSVSSNIDKTNVWTGSFRRDSTSIAIHPGEKDRAHEFIRNWLRSSALEYLIICDPYFGPEDLVSLQMIRESNPQCQIKILTSEKHQKQEKILKPWDESYQSYWKRSISDQVPPDTDIVIAGIASSGELPIHDRWWIADGRALRFGTSFRSLGGAKLTEISQMSANQAYDKEQEVNKYIGINREREYLGERLRYSMFTL